jgi:hypothetical protein
LREKRRLKKERTGDSPERDAQHHAAKRTWGDRVAHSAAGGERHTVADPTWTPLVETPPIPDYD